MCIARKFSAVKPRQLTLTCLGRSSGFMHVMMAVVQINDLLCRHDGDCVQRERSPAACPGTTQLQDDVKRCPNVTMMKTLRQSSLRAACPVCAVLAMLSHLRIDLEPSAQASSVHNYSCRDRLHKMYKCAASG